MTQLSRYNTYKPSGVDWLGDIPEHWEVKSLKHIAFMQSGATISPEQFTDEGYPVYGGNGFRGYTKSYTNDGEFVLIGRQGALCGNVNYASGKFYASEHAIVVYPLKNESVRWLGELIRVADFNRLSQSAAQPGIAVNIIKNEYFPYPPLCEQTAIATFLDQKTEQIEQAIAIKQQQIALLKERKQIIIQQAVTQGLNPNAPMKDSGVEWIGKIPEHWEVEKAKWLFLKAERLPREHDEIVTCFRDGQVTLRSNRRLDGFTNAIKEHGYQGIRKGDLVIHAMDAFAGAIGVSDSDGKSTPVYSACTPINDKQVNTFFYAYFLRDLALSGFIVSLAKGIRERSSDFRFNDFTSLMLPLPPIPEQTAIVTHIETQSTQIDQAIALQQQQIDKLKEYKTTLINSVVTGKVRVSDDVCDGVAQIDKDAKEN